MDSRQSTAAGDLPARPQKRMLALTVSGAKSAKIREVLVPMLLDTSDVVVKVTGTTVCDSDVHFYHNEILSFNSGDILGHEFVGVVIGIASNVHDFKKGDRVVGSFQLACGGCKACTDDRPAACGNLNSQQVQGGLYGARQTGPLHTHFCGGTVGAQAEFLRIPFGDFNLLKIPESLPDEKAIFLSDLVPTSYHAARCANLKKGDNVAIWGLGPLGLLIAQWCKLMGANKVVGIDPNPERLAVAQYRLKIDVTNSKEIDLQDLCKKLPGGLPVCIHTQAFKHPKKFFGGGKAPRGTDPADSFYESMKIIKKFGHIVVCSPFSHQLDKFSIGELMEKGLTLRGTGQAPVQLLWPELLPKIVSGEFDPLVALSHRFHIKDLPDVYKAYDAKRPELLKVFIQTKYSGPIAANTPPLSTFSGSEIKVQQAPLEEEIVTPVGIET